MMNYGFNSSKVWILFALLSLAAGVLFLVNLHSLFPLAKTDIKIDRDTIETKARKLLESRGFDLDGYESSSRFSVRESVLEYIQREFGKDRAQTLINDGLPVYRYKILFKKQGNPRKFRAVYTPGAGLTSWWKTLREKDPGKTLTVQEARRKVRKVIRSVLDLNLSEHKEKTVSTSKRPKRVDHFFRYEKTISKDPELKEWITARVGGGRVTSVGRNLRIPDTAKDKARAREASPMALQTLGFIFVGLACLTAFFYFLMRLREGKINMLRAAVLPGIVMICYILKLTLSGPDLFWNWDPLWSRWISNFRYISFRLGGYMWILLLLFICVGAGDSVDRREGWNRGRSLWTLIQGRIFDRAVAYASLNGFLIGLLCGGVIAVSVAGLRFFSGAQTGIQPRGFYFFTLNTVNPPVAALLFFVGVALTEELGYRFFAGSWLLSFSGRKWIAVVVPGIAYGLTHTGLSFLPPSQPYWARPLVLTLMGCVWGWAFLKFDALTVILSHLTADLFIFNVPLLARGGVTEIIYSTGIVLVPLIPAVIYIPGSLLAGD